MKLRNLLIPCLFTLLVNTSQQSFATEISHKSNTLIAAIDTVPNDSLIISEVKTANNGSRYSWGYIELTNTSSRTMDLKHYWLQTAKIFEKQPLTGSYVKAPLKGLLEPGKSFVFMIPTIVGDKDAYGKLIYKNSNYGNRELLERANMVFRQTFDYFISYSNYSLWYAQDSLETIAKAIDVWNEPRLQPIAGVAGANPATARIYVRKSQVKKGNIDWTQSRGTDIADAEWLPIPNNMMADYGEVLYKTVGNHGTTTQLSMSSTIATINEATKTITIPYGYRRDSVARYFSFGMNHSWNFKTNGDTSKYLLQTNDTLEVYLCGNDLQKISFAFSVQPKTQNFNELRPLKYKNTSGSYTTKYTVSKGIVPMDTIGNVPFAVRRDTLLKYLEVEPDCKMEIVYGDGKARPDLKNGDLVKVTSPNGSTKNYRISVMAYFPSHTATIKNIIFPGMPLWLNTNTYEMTDTMNVYTTNNNAYQIKLPADTKVPPAILVIPSDAKATVNVLMAKNLNGNEQDRTSTITVYAEDDTTTNKVQITFNVERETPALTSDPFFTDYGFNTGGQNHLFMQIFNPRKEVVDMSEYVLVLGKGTLNGWNALSTAMLLDSALVANRTLRPGFRPKKNSAGEVIWTTDITQGDRYLIPGNGTYKIASNGSYPFAGNTDQNIMRKINFEASKNGAKPRYGETNLLSHFALPAQILPCENAYMVLLKINNDSVRDGMKAFASTTMGNDYTIVDLMGDFTSPTPWQLWDKVDGKDTVYTWSKYNCGYLYRKSTVYKGNSQNMGAFGAGVVEANNTKHTIITGEWVQTAFANNATVLAQSLDMAKKRFDNHVMTTAVNVSYVLSNTYLVSQGLSQDETIYGISAATSVSDFKKNLILSDTNMVIRIMDKTGAIRTSGTIVQGDKLTSVSALKTDSVTYTLNIGSISNNVLLTSTKYTVAKADTTGIIKGITLGTSIVKLLEELVIPENASLFITNGKEMLMPLYTATNDTNMIKKLQRAETLVTPGLQLKVLAQDGVTKCVYSVELDKTAHPAIYSTVYSIDQSSKIVNFINGTSVKVFLHNLTTNAGNSIRVYDYENNLRSMGSLKYDDRLYAVSADGKDSVLYLMKFTDETGAGSGVENAIKKTNALEVKCYPNPASDMLFVAGSFAQIEIIDVTGKCVLKTNTLNASKIDIRNLESGVYMLKAHNKKGQLFTCRIVKQ